MLESISREVDKAWLAGFLDGEGCITAWFYTCKPPRRGLQFVVRVHFSNNDAIIIRKSSEILSSMQIGYCYQLQKRKNEKHNTGIVLTVNGKGRIKKLLNNLMPYLTGKKEQAEIMLKVIDRREEMTRPRKKGKYLTDDVILVSLVKDLRKAKHTLPVNPSETTRRANYPLTW